MIYSPGIRRSPSLSTNPNPDPSIDLSPFTPESLTDYVQLFEDTLRS